VFSVAYFIFFQFSPASWTIEQSYQAAMAEDLRRQFAEIGELQPDAATLVKYMHDEKWRTVGESTFKAQCVSCHGAKAEGSIGPNLTDDFYKNIRVIEDIPKVVANGAANGAMPAWKTRLHPNEVVLVSAYVASLRGQNLPGPRPKEGEAIDPWPAAATAASVAGN
jgi:cytochrome c oxidase cbb3-type subunit 3